MNKRFKQKTNEKVFVFRWQHRSEKSILLFYFKVTICRFANLELNNQDVPDNITFIWFSLTDEKGVSDKTKLCRPLNAVTVKITLMVYRDKRFKKLAPLSRLQISPPDSLRVLFSSHSLSSFFFFLLFFSLLFWSRWPPIPEVLTQSEKEVGIYH